VAEIARVERSQLDVRKPTAGDREPFLVQRAADQPDLRQRVRDRGENDPSAAADLEERRRVRETASERRDDQAVPRAEPEAPLLHVGERLEEIGIEARARHAGNASSASMTSA